MDRKWITVWIAFLLLGGCTRPEVPLQKVEGSEIQRPAESADVTQAPPVETSGESAKPTEEVQTPPVETTVKSVKIAPASLTLVVGDRHKLKATVVDSRGDERRDIPVLWSSSNPTIVGVSSNGLATAVAPGSAAITAQADEMSAALPLMVSLPPVEKIEIRPVNTAIRVGKTQQFQAIVLDTRQKERGDVQISWASNDSSIAMVNKTGLVLGVNSGDTTITATAEGITSSATLTVQAEPTTEIETKPSVETSEVPKEPSPPVMAEAPLPTPVPSTIETQSSSSVETSEVSKEPPPVTTSPPPVMAEAPLPTPVPSTQVVQAAPATPPPAQPPKGPPKGPDVKLSPEVEQKMKEKLERMKKKLKDIDPSKIIYLDSRGNVASTGAPTEIRGEGYRAGLAEHPLAMELVELPKDRFGLVNWVEALNSGKIKPVDSLEKGTADKRPMPVPDITIETKSKTQPDVVFSHKIHTSWFPVCDTCHGGGRSSGIFKQKAGGNPEMHMTKIAAGQYCGRCHNRVAFPLEDCKRCHVKEKGNRRSASSPPTETEKP